MDDSMPHNEQIEQALIGCLIIDNEAPGMAQANYDITPEMFYTPIHQLIVREIYELSEKQHGYVDAIMVQNQFRKKGLLSEMPDPMYLMKCGDLSPVSHNMRSYCEEIKSLYYKRQVIHAARDVSTRAFEAESGQEYLMEVPQRFFDLMPKAGSDLSLADSLAASVEQWRKIQAGEMGIPGLSTGIAELDELLTGMKPGSYIAVGARPSSGKTTLAGDVMDYNCQAGNGVAWVNMDMPRADLEQRWLCRRARVSLPKLNAGHAGEKNFASIMKAQEEISKWPLHALHATRDVSKICAWLRLKVKREGVKLVVIDYIQKCTADHIRSHDPVRVISYSSAAIKELCQELSVPVLVLAQLGRGDPKRENQPPTMDSFKGCGDLEQDAQVAMLMYKYPKFDYQAAGVNEVTDRAIVLDIAKQQNGGTGRMEFWFRTSYFTMQAAHADWGYPEAVG